MRPRRAHGRHECSCGSIGVGRGESGGNAVAKPQIYTGWTPVVGEGPSADSGPRRTASRSGAGGELQFGEPSLDSVASVEVLPLPVQTPRPFYWQMNPKARGRKRNPRSCLWSIPVARPGATVSALFFRSHLCVSDASFLSSWWGSGYRFQCELPGAGAYREGGPMVQSPVPVRCSGGLRRRGRCRGASSTGR